MKIRKIFSCMMVAMITGAVSAEAGVADFADFFVIDLENDDLPSLTELEALTAEKDNYNKNYGSFYDLQGDFDRDFYVMTAEYGSREKRIKGESEDLYLEFLAMTPKKYYQYLGPMLFEVPNMSEKILNLPGIKETKNKFPTRIAPQLKDVENLEFMSPALYFLLMPEAWPGFYQNIEQPQRIPYKPKVVYDKDFYAAIKKLVKPEKFMPGYQEENKLGKSDLRTLHPDKNSVLTAADIEAFVTTIDAVDSWAKEPQNEFWLSRVGIMLMTYEHQQGIGKYVPAGLKDLVNPCARLVQKARILNKELELASIVAKEGFTLNEWAYTCDKTIKAYRLANVRAEVVTAIREYKRGIYDGKITGMSPYTQNARFAIMQSIIQAHNAPLRDVLELKKNRQDFEQKLKKRGYHLFGYPINRY